MRIRYIKNDPLQVLKSNYEHVYDLICNNDVENWLTELLGQDSFGESKIMANDFEFYYSGYKPIEDDLENSKRIFEAFKNLTETQAVDERLWVGLSLTKGYDYLIHRWGLNSKTKIKYRWIYYTRNRRTLFYHGLARLWWHAKLTYDPSRDNPYELTEFAYKHPEILKNMTYRNFSNSEKIRHAIIVGLMNYETEGKKIVYEKLVELYKYMSYLGGIYILDSFTHQELVNKVSDFLNRL